MSLSQMKAVAMRRPSNPSRRIAESSAAPFAASIQSKPRSSPYLSVGLIVGAFLVIGYIFRGQGGSGSIKGAFGRLEGDLSCTLEVLRAIPLLRKAYGDSMNKVLHVGPDTCSVVFELLKDENTEAWGLEPYDIEDADRNCNMLVHRGIVRVADIKFPLPYRDKSFPLVIVSDALDYLSPKNLNRTLPDLARVSADGLVIFTGYPRRKRAEAMDKFKFARLAKLRNSNWWMEYFVQTSLEENEAAIKKFDIAAAGRSYLPRCQNFHLKSYQ